MPFYYLQNQRREKAIERHNGLIMDLRSIQPASINELASESGQSSSATRSKLNELIPLEIIKPVRFEHHTLFCLNGCHDLQISSVLSLLFDRDE